MIFKPRAWRRIHEMSLEKKSKQNCCLLLAWYTYLEGRRPPFTTTTLLTVWVSAGARPRDVLPSYGPGRAFLYRKLLSWENIAETIGLLRLLHTWPEVTQMCRMYVREKFWGTYISINSRLQLKYFSPIYRQQVVLHIYFFFIPSGFLLIRM